MKRDGVNKQQGEGLDEGPTNSTYYNAAKHRAIGAWKVKGRHPSNATRSA